MELHQLELVRQAVRLSAMLGHSVRQAVSLSTVLGQSVSRAHDRLTACRTSLDEQLCSVKLTKNAQLFNGGRVGGSKIRRYAYVPTCVLTNLLERAIRM